MSNRALFTSNRKSRPLLTQGLMGRRKKEKEKKKSADISCWHWPYDIGSRFWDRDQSSLWILHHVTEPGSELLVEIPKVERSIY